jgi:hypothetical protein
MPATNSASPRLSGRVRFRLLGIGWQFRRWSSYASLGHCHNAPTAGLIPLSLELHCVFLALLGGLAARAGGAGVTMGAIRVTFWGALAMALTAGVGALFGTIS